MNQTNIRVLLITGKGKSKGEVLPVLTKYHATKTCWGNGGIAPRILNLATREVSGQLHSPGALTPSKSPRNSLDRRLGRLQKGSGSGGEEKKSHHCPYWELNPSRSASSLYTD